MMIVASNSITVSNVNDGTIVHIAYANSADGTDGFYVGGGTNLLINTSSSSANGQTVMQGASAKILGVYSRTDSYEQVTAPSSGEFYYRFMYPDANKLYGLAPGETYTLSGSASLTSGTLQARTQYYNGSGWIDLDYLTDLGIPVSDGLVFKPFSYTFTVPVGATGIYFSLQNNDYTDGSLFRFKNMKLEKGSEAHPKYMGTYTDFTQADSLDPTAYSWTQVKGDDGKDGVDGKDGLGIKSTAIAYQLSSSGTTTPTGTWSNTVPALTKGQYLWTRTTLTYTDNSSEPVYSVSYVAKDGNNGSDGVAGKDGVGIKSTETTYAVSTSGTTIPTTGWATTPPALSDGKYLWTRTLYTYTDNSTEPIYAVAKSGSTGPQGPKGDPGKDGVAGKDGLGIKSTTITYQLGTSGTTAPTGTWSSTVPSLVKGQYLWTKTMLTYTDSSTETLYSVSYVAKDGNSGKDGVAGKDGVGIKSTTVTYQVSSSGTTIPTGAWSSNPPAISAGQYMWTRTVWTYTDGTTEPGYSVAMSGKNGAQGPKGDKGDTGIPGKAGADGRTPYNHVAWSWSADGSDRFSTSYPNENVMSESKLLDSSKWHYTEATKGSGAYTLGNGVGVIDGVANTGYTWMQWQQHYNENTNADVFELIKKHPNEKISLSFDVKVDGNMTLPSTLGTLVQVSFRGSTGQPAQISIKPSDLTLGQTKRFTVTGTMPASFDGITEYRYILCFYGTGKMTFMNPKMEFSDVATIYTPSPLEDSDAAYPTYRGEYTDYTEADSTDYKKYTWTRVRGDKGESLNTIKVTSAAFQNNPVPQPGIWISGEEVAGVGTGAGLSTDTNYNNWGRGHNLVVLNKDTFKVESIKNYDDYTTPTLADTLATDINALKDKIVIVLAMDDSTMTANLRAALTACGGNPDISTYKSNRSAHILIGMSKDANGKSVLQPRQGYEIFDSSASAVRTIYASQGGDGLAVNGQTGQSPYLHTAYADSADGTLNFSTDYTEKNLLLDTDAPTLTKVNGPADRCFSDGQVDYFGAKIVAITDGVNGSKYASQFTKPNDGLSGKQTALCWYSNKSTGLKEGHTYKVSAYFRIVDGKGTRARFQIGSGPYDNKTSVFSSNQWTKVEETYTISTTLHGGSPRVYIGIYSPASSYGTLQMTYPEVTEVSPKYMGTYSDFNEVDSTDPKKYTWVKIQGGDGPAGKDSHTHIAYANSADGVTDFSIADSNRDYVGMYWDYEDAASTDPSKYKWTKTKGRDGTQGIPGPTGPNGKDSQFHQAWADSSDGKVGFSTTISLGKKYLGTYTDYVAADSTDPTKYKWVELAGAIEIGGTNIYLDTKDITNTDLWFANQYWTKQADKYNGLAVMQTTGSWNGLSQYVKVKTGEVYTFSVYARYTSGTGTSNIYWLLNGGSESEHASAQVSTINKFVNLSDSWQKISATTTITADGYIRPRLERTDNNDNVLQIAGMKLERGNKATDWSQAPEDIDKAIDDANSHTDDAINDVNNGIDNIYDVLGNKADADEFKDLQDQAQALQDSYDAFISSDGQYETDLTNLENRATALYESLGDKLLQLSFINTWMKVGEEGLLIGSEDSSVKMLLGNDQLSFTDGGQTVAYFTAQSFYINKGAVVTSLQVNMHKLSRIDDNHTAFVYTG